MNETVGRILWRKNNIIVRKDTVTRIQSKYNFPVRNIWLYDNRHSTTPLWNNEQLTSSLDFFNQIINLKFKNNLSIQYYWVNWVIRVGQYQASSMTVSHHIGPLSRQKHAIIAPILRQYETNSTPIALAVLLFFYTLKTSMYKTLLSFY